MSKFRCRRILEIFAVGTQLSSHVIWWLGRLINVMQHLSQRDLFEHFIINFSTNKNKFQSKFEKKHYF